ncbi:MAG TPA: TonB family protein [Vicinamibacterales bacterium]
MFETSVVKERVDQRRYSLLSVSLAAHTLIVIAVIAVGISSTSFPKAPPHEYQVFFQSQPPPPPPAAPRQPTQQPAQPHQAPAANNLPHAATVTIPMTPNQIPNAIPNVPQSSNDIAIGNSATPGTGSSDIGDPNSVDVGQPPATNITPTPDTVFHPGADVRPAIVLYRVEPEYPRATLVARMGGTVVLKCVIDKNGNVRDPEVVTSSFNAFNEPALEALKRWRFTPGSLHGKAVDTWFELTIRFQPR